MAKMSLSNASVADLKKEIQRRQSVLPTLVAQRDELDRRIAELQALGQVVVAVAARPSAPVRPAALRGRRTGNKVALPQLLSKLLMARSGQSVNELTEAALAAGYKSSAKSFKSIVRQTLYHDPRFKRVGRGRFAVKG